MTVFRLNQTRAFPDPSEAEPNGLLAVGGDLSPERLLNAYAQGIFPWPVDGLPLTWFSPDPRMVLRPSEAKVSRSLRKTIRRETFRVTADSAFLDVILACAGIRRNDDGGTWITHEIAKAYERLHNLGFAHSIEVWNAESELVGGLYGVSIGDVFCGESMFHLEANASKVAFVTLARQLVRWKFELIDCQLHTPHLESLGANTVPRAKFLAELSEVVDRPSRVGAWTLDEDIWVDRVEDKASDRPVGDAGPKTSRMA